MKKLKKVFRISIIKTIYFNFHYLPFKQAIKLPIILFNSQLLKCNGHITIKGEIKTGMIQFGNKIANVFASSKVIWENNGGNVVFNGRCIIGNSSAISIGQNGYLEFGDNFLATQALKLIAFHYVKFGCNVLVGWDIIIMDTSFHSLKDMDGNLIGTSYEPIIIGKNNWIPNKCMILKGSKTPDYCIFGAGAILNKDYSKNLTHILLAGNPLQVKKSGIWWDNSDDNINYLI